MRSTRLNESLVFCFDLTSLSSGPQKIILYYRIHYVKKSGSCSPKTFKLRELKLDAMATVKISKRQRFQDFTTRTHFSGKHTLDILANGKVIGSKAFQFKRWLPRFTRWWLNTEGYCCDQLILQHFLRKNKARGTRYGRRNVLCVAIVLRPSDLVPYLSRTLIIYLSGY